MKYTIYKDERYPDYGLTSDNDAGVETEVSTELAERYRLAENEYEAVQEELAKLYKAAR